MNAVRPGLIATDIHASGGMPDRVQRFASKVPMQRGGTAEEGENRGGGGGPTRGHDVDRKLRYRDVVDGVPEGRAGVVGEVDVAIAAEKLDVGDLAADLGVALERFQCDVGSDHHPAERENDDRHRDACRFAHGLLGSSVSLSAFRRRRWMPGYPLKAPSIAARGRSAAR